jgi:hypothetical protein
MKDLQSHPATMLKAGYPEGLAKLAFLESF